MNQPRYISLELYAEMVYQPPLPITTARRWARDGRIPGAKKQGRGWWVDTQAEPIDAAKIVDHLLSKIDAAN